MLGALAQWESFSGVRSHASFVAYKGIDRTGGVVGDGFGVLGCGWDLWNAGVSGWG